MNSILEGEKRPKTPQVDANRLVNLSSDQLQDTSLSTPGKALEPAGLSDLKGIALVEAENLRLRLHLQRLQGQLTEQRLYQVRHTSPACSWQAVRSACTVFMH